MFSSAQFKYIFLSVLLLLGMISFSKTTFDILQTSKRLQDMHKTVGNLEDQKKSLEKDLKYKKTARFIEEEARNRLNMIKKGEKVLVFPEVQAKTTSNTNIKNKAPKSIKTAQNLDSTQENQNLNYFWQWVELFF